MTATDELIPWLRAQLDEDERVARGAVGGWITKGPHPDDRTPVGSHMALHDPARVLREVEATRQLLDECVSADAALTEIWMWETCEGGYSSGLDRAVRILALSYADRPGYRDEWRP